jgi:hypothetical protein
VQEDQERVESFERSHLHLMRLAPSFWSDYCSPRRSVDLGSSLNWKHLQIRQLRAMRTLALLLCSLLRTSRQKHKKTLQNVVTKGGIQTFHSVDISVNMEAKRPSDTAKYGNTYSNSIFVEACE